MRSPLPFGLRRLHVSRAMVAVRVTVLNADRDILLALRELLIEERLEVTVATLSDLDYSPARVLEFLDRHDPHVVVYDIAPPYEKHLRLLESLQGPETRTGRLFVLTTTDLGHLSNYPKPPGIIEVLPKPFKLDALLRVIRRASDESAEARRQIDRT